MDDVSLAAELVREAGMLASEMLTAGLETEYKTSVSDVVSAADHAAEQLVTERLAESRPDDGLVGEEGARKTGDGRTWYIDPVDGTYNFLSGVPYWCSAVGLVDGDGPLLGAVYYPALDQLWVGGRDHPTTLNDVPVERLTRAAAGRGLGRDLLPSPALHRPGPARVLAVGDVRRGHRADAGLSLDRPGQRGQQPARDLPAGQPAPVGLVSGRRAGARRRRGGRANCRWGEPLADRRQRRRRRGHRARAQRRPNA